MKCTRVFLAEYDLDHNFAVVNIDAFLGVHVGSSQRVLESVLRGAAYVVGRGVSGDLISRSVELGCDLSVSKHGQDLESKTSEVHLHVDMTILFCFSICTQAIK